MTFCMRFLFWGASRIAGVFALGFRQTIRRISTTNAMYGNSKRGAWKRRTIGLEPRANENVKSTAHLDRIREATNSKSVPARHNGIRLLEATVYPDGRIVYRAETPEEVRMLLDLVGKAQEGTPRRFTACTVAPHPITTAVTLTEAIRRYHAHRSTIVERGGANPQTEAERVLTLNEFQLWHQSQATSQPRTFRRSGIKAQGLNNDGPVSAIGFTMISTYVEHLLHTRKLSIKTMQKKGSNLHLFFEYLRKAGLFPQDQPLPTEGQFKVSNYERTRLRKTNARAVFTTAELQKIFDPDKLHPAPEQYPMRPHQLWFPLIGLFTGARNTEICALRVEDFSFQGDIPTMFLPGTKTDYAPRHVPIHAKLIELGLWEYVEHVKTAGFDLIFPYLSLSKKGSRAKVPTDNFHAVLEDLAIKTPYKVFYSFRHGLIQQMTGPKGVHPDWSRDYTGHRPQDVHKKQYGMTAFVEILKLEVVDKFEFDAVDLEPLKRFKGKDWKLADLVSEFAHRKSAYHETVVRNQPSAARAATARVLREAQNAEILGRRRNRS